MDCLDEFGAALPFNFLTPGAAGAARESGQAPASAGAHGAGAFLELESARLGTAFVELAHRTRAARTTAGFASPALKQLWWFVSQECPPPPTQANATDYFTSLALDRDNRGAVATARSGLLHLCRLIS